MSGPNPYDTDTYRDYRARVLGEDGVGNSDSFDRLDDHHKPIVLAMADRLNGAWPLQYIGSQQDARTDATWLFARRHPQTDPEPLALDLATDLHSDACGGWRGGIMETGLTAHHLANLMVMS